MNRFVRRDGRLEEVVKSIVREGFPVVNASQTSGVSRAIFDVDGPMSMTGGEFVSLIVENKGENEDVTGKNLMVWTISRWGDSTVVQ